jgi:hypothetical protein
LSETLKATICATESLIEDLNAGDKVVERFRTLPRVGEFSILIHHEIGETDRLSSSKKLLGYTDLLLSACTSNKIVIQDRAP